MPMKKHSSRKDDIWEDEFAEHPNQGLRSSFDGQIARRGLSRKKCFSQTCDTCTI